MEDSKKKYTIVLLSTNRPGVLVRIALVFSRINFNIESLNVSSLKDENYSKLTITAEGHQKDIKQIVKQLKSLVDVLDAYIHNSENAVERNLALIKIEIEEERTDLIQIVEHFKAKIIDMTNKSLIIQICHDEYRINSFLTMLSKFKIKEIVKTGKLTLPRGL